MTISDDNKTSNYGSTSSVEDGGDTFDVNDVLISRDQSHPQRPSLSAVSHTNHSTQSKRSLFDGWLRRDHSVRQSLTSSLTTSFRSVVNTTIGLRGDDRLAEFLGPTVSCNLTSYMIN